MRNLTASGCLRREGFGASKPHADSGLCNGHGARPFMVSMDALSTDGSIES